MRAVAVVIGRGGTASAAGPAPRTAPEPSIWVADLLKGAVIMRRCSVRDRRASRTVRLGRRSRRSATPSSDCTPVTSRLDAIANDRVAPGRFDESAQFPASAVPDGQLEGSLTAPQ